MENMVTLFNVANLVAPMHVTRQCDFIASGALTQPERLEIKI
jgi:hypothetical protein